MDLAFYIEKIALGVAYIGVFIVLLGVLGTFFKFLYYLPSGHPEREFSEIRHFMMLYLTLGLDFLIAKDIMLTLLIERGEGYTELFQLLIIIAIRIILSYFIHMEDSFLQKFKSERKPKKG